MTVWSRPLGIARARFALLSWGPLAVFTRGWRRSVQLRVVLSTAVLSAVVIGLLGWVLLRQITEGLVDERVSESNSTAARVSAELQQTLNAATADFDGSVALPSLMSGLLARGEVQGYEVVLIGPLGEDAQDSGGVRFTPGLNVDSVPAALRARVQAVGNTSSAWTFSRVRYDNVLSEPSEGAAGVVVGDRLDLPARGDRYALYYLFPMTAEARTLTLVERALFTSGALLVLLVAAVSWLVARQVVSPVRLARRTAERLASGRLDQRMVVKGEDDLARLAMSFNQMANSLQRQFRKLEDMSVAQRRFVSDVSHELRTPLTTVRMAADVLHDARSQFDPLTQRSAELLADELDRFENLLADLLEISRFDAGAADLELDDVDLYELAQRVVSSLDMLSARTGVPVVVKPPSESCIVEADPRRVERVLRNLVTNALDYAESSAVEVSLASAPDCCSLAVRDFGVGLHPGDELRVFNRFWRADPSRTRTTGGTGLGLSISREDARLHGGTLEAWGERGKGAQFVLTLPLHPGAMYRAAALPLIGSTSGQQA